MLSDQHLPSNEGGLQHRSPKPLDAADFDFLIVHLDDLSDDHMTVLEYHRNRFAHLWNSLDHKCLRLVQTVDLEQQGPVQFRFERFHGPVGPDQEEGGFIRQGDVDLALLWLALTVFGTV